MKTLLTTLALFSVCFAQGASWEPRTREAQQAMTPDQVLAALMAGNERFRAGHAKDRDFLNEAKLTAKKGQFPIAAVVSCLDSRVPVEVVFDQGIGDVFVGRVAGNVEGSDMIGSLEFATRVSGAKVIMVMGHDACGAVAGAIAGVELGNLTGLLEKIAPAEKKVVDFDGPRTAGNPEFVDAVGVANVVRTINEIRRLSPILRDMEEKGEIIIVGTFYTLNDGRVSLVYPEN